MIRRLGLWLAVVALAGLAAGCGAKASDTIRVGVLASLTGDTATFGVSSRNGVEMAVEEVNKAGGLLGKQVEVFTEDDRSQAPEAATAVTRLINQHRVVAVIGELASTRSMAAAPICQRSHIPMISPASTDPDVTAKGDCIFRVCFIDPFQGAVMAKFAYNTLKARRVAILQDKTQEYSVGLAGFFRDTFKELGGEIIEETSFSSGDIDFKAQLTGIAAKKPDALFVPSYYNAAGLIARQAREVGITVPLLGGDGWDSPKLVETAGKAVEGCYFSNHYSVEDKSPRIQAFVTTYKERYQSVPDALAALSYDAARILFDAIKRAGSTESQPLRDAVAGTSGFEGVTGTITLDGERNAVKPAVVLRIQDGQFRYLETVQP